MDRSLLLQRYENLVQNKSSWFLYENNPKPKNNATGEIGSSWYYFPGSFNPIHEGHFAIFNSISVPNKFFELSINIRGKGTLSFEGLEKRLAQFDNFARVVVTDSMFFKQKAEILPGPAVFMVGYDTALRLLQDDGDVGIDCIPAKFMVYPREAFTIDNLPAKPHNFIPAPPIDPSLLYFSSTKIRNGE